MMQGWSRKRRMLTAALTLLGISVLWIYFIAKSFIDEENLELRSIYIKAAVTGKEHLHYVNAGAERYNLRYLRKGTVYTNVVQTGLYNFNVGDSIQIKIDSRNPAAYCELVD
ncbi:hypothetical protein HHL22_01665 [Hymenobacter sp. RP-2-7]|uniref:Uncharacterized protein n=1 Tax=Hymenobacter polaris TaxID=2682546 RepID=A0A7Y0AB09_9BACT|nr:hypothetical protein [Hymenobacter polaris]NML63902.1 hypothetical protein [Hymenobacter polaris]